MDGPLLRYMHVFRIMQSNVHEKFVSGIFYVNILLTSGSYFNLVVLQVNQWLMWLEQAEEESDDEDEEAAADN